MRYRERRNVIKKVAYVISMACCIFTLAWIGNIGYAVWKYLHQAEYNYAEDNDEGMLRQMEIEIEKNIKDGLSESLEEDNGTGCEIPNLDPFSPEIMKFDKTLPPTVCKNPGWVKCYLSECKVTPEILNTTDNIRCTYRNIIYVWDFLHYITKTSSELGGNDVYILKDSDHILVNCEGESRDYSKHDFVEWEGVAAGLRSTVKPPPVPTGREDTVNVLIFGFDSASKNGFIRKMPKSYKFLKFGLKATILTRYNIVGDDTSASLLPLLSGQTEWTFTGSRKSFSDHEFDQSKLIFHKVKQYGYRTAYFEDRPTIGTFQYRFNGFSSRPADHYLYDFYQEVHKMRSRYIGDADSHCIDDTPQYKFMMNITDQFFKLDGKKFCFTFLVSTSHNDFNKITSADDEFMRFLERFRSDGNLKDTLLLVMGDHGVRYSDVLATYQGKLEKRLPLMAVVLPEQLLRKRPEIKSALQSNKDVLTTPHDIYATVLDALDLRHHWNLHKVKGAQLMRGLTLFEKIPRTRSCSEAGIEAHWCTCLRWVTVPQSNAMYRRTAAALVYHINAMTGPYRRMCVERFLISINYVLAHVPNKQLLSYYYMDDDFTENFYSDKSTKFSQYIPAAYQLQVDTMPGNAKYEATLTYNKTGDNFIIKSRDISRINAYGNESSCISQIFPHLNPFCYCRRNKISHNEGDW